MQLVTLYGATLALFLLIDIVGITTLIKPVFERHVGEMLADPLIKLLILQRLLKSKA